MNDPRPSPGLAAGEAQHPDGERIARYAGVYRSIYDFEKRLVAARHRTIVEFLHRRAPAVVVEVGCGEDLLYDVAVAEDLSFARWIIVEPSAAFVDAARARLGAQAPVTLVPAFFEEPQVADACQGLAVDAVVLSGVLNEVEHPERLLAQARRIVRPGGAVHALVPNARSLHRRLAKAMGLIDDLAAPSARNAMLMQAHVFHPEEIEALVAAAGFAIVGRGGHSIKPFTNAQMEACLEHLPDGILEGLRLLGADLPDLACEVFVEAMRPAEGDDR